jgi:hypothetical protein
VDDGLGGLAALIGQTMLVSALVLAVAGLTLTLPRLLRVRRRALALSARLRTARVDILGAVNALEQRREDAEQSLRPMRRLWKWFRHPLSVATMASFRRRRHRALTPD